jgi:hypothetical protein
MRNLPALVCAALLLMGTSRAALSQSADAIPVTPDNFVRAETDRAFAGEAELGGFSTLRHHREPLKLEEQIVPRVNRDTLYSTGVFDLDAGPVTITTPNAGDRFLSLIVIDEDHYVHGVYYDAGPHTLTKDDIGTRYVFTALRTLVNPDDPNDVKAVHALQDATKVEQPGGPGAFQPPKWDAASQKVVRNALIALSSTLPNLRRAFGSRQEVDPVRHLIATASAWGGNPDKDALYLNITPAGNNGAGVYELSVPAAVPVDAFWSITVYDAQGYIDPNPLNAYNVNSVTGRKSADGSVTVQFGGCDGETPNCLPIMKGWNYIVRLYRPRAEILNGGWTFPEARRSE